MFSSSRFKLISSMELVMVACSSSLVEIAVSLCPGLKELTIRGGPVGQEGAPPMLSNRLWEAFVEHKRELRYTNTWSLTSML